MHCPGCGKEIPDVVAVANCPSCGAVLRPAGERAAPPPSSGTIPSGIPWEHRAELGFLPTLIATLRSCLMDPDGFYSRMPKRENLGAAIGYLVLLGWLGGLGGLFWGIALQGTQEALLRGLGMEPSTHALSAAARMALYIGAAILYPLGILVAAFVWSGILHVPLWILGGAKEGFEATLRVYCYAAGSAGPFQWIPICGGLIGAVWSLIVQIYGISRAHGISGGLATLAVLLPLALCCIVIGVIAVTFAGFILSTLKGASI